MNNQEGKNQKPPDQPKQKQKWYLRWYAILFYVVIVLVAFWIARDFGESKKEEITSEQETAPQEETVIEPSSEDLPETILGGGDPKQIDQGSQKYEVVDSLTLTNNGSSEIDKIELWFGLLSDASPYQDVTKTEISPADYIEETDDKGNRYAHFVLGPIPAGTSQEVELNFQVQVNEIFNYLGNCKGKSIEDHLDSEKYIESDDPRIQKKAEQVTVGATNDCEKASALYEYVAENFEYTGFNAESYGAVYALDNMGGDCSEFSNLLVALSRASGVPARYVDGYAYTSDPNADLGEKKHSWVEFYLPGTGWTPADPTWGRLNNLRNKEFSQSDGKHMKVLTGENLDILGGYFYYYYKIWGGTSEQLNVSEDLQITKP